MTISSHKNPVEAKTWVEVFGLEDRYKDQCVKENKGKHWLRQIMQEGFNYGKTPKEMYEIALKTNRNNMLNELNFIKIPLLNAADKIGLF